VLGLIAASIALLVSAIASYPGGTSFDRSAPGHDLLRNFLCDLTAPVALNGAANTRGAALASLAIVLLGLALVLFWWTLAGLAFAGQARGVVRATGVFSSIALMTLPLTRWAPLLWFHPLVVFTSAVPGLVAAGTCIYGLGRCGRQWRPLWALGVATFVLTSIDSVLYAIHLITRTPVVLALPALQRLATLMFLGFVGVGALRMRAERPGVSKAPP
jgi:hypothetical protein